MEAFSIATVNFRFHHLRLGGEYSLTRGYWGCAAGWGLFFTPGVAKMGLHFQ